MARTTFRKTLSANDVGSTGGHQAGILIPKGEKELLAMLPPLDPGIKNPNVWLDCVDESGEHRRFKFRYYNNKLHDPTGTRNEYRVTYMTAWFRNLRAQEGDFFEISKGPEDDRFRVRVIPASAESPEPSTPAQIHLRGWRRVH